MRPRAAGSAGLAAARAALLAAALALGAARAAPADFELLERFFQVKTLTASFAQSVYDTRENLVGESRGVVALSRPGRIRWEYTTGDRQIFIADGHNLLNYDPDLEQAVVSPLGKALGHAPLMLLMSDQPMAHIFKARRLPARDDGLDWLQLTPKAQDTDFKTIALGFRGQLIERMELRDTLDQRTVISFQNLAPDAPVGAEEFHVYLPPGVDVMGEMMSPVPVEPRTEP